MPKNPERSPKRRMVVAAAAVVVLAAAGWGIWATTRPQPAPQEHAIAARTATLRQTVSSSGTIEPAQQSNLNFGAAGQVTAVDVSVGQQVIAGQPLAAVSSAFLTASVAEAKSALASDQTKLTTDQNANSAAAQLNADQAAVDAAQNQLTNAQNALAGATLTSPIAGTVAAVNLTVGQQVSAGGSTSGSSANSSGNSSGGSGSSAGGQAPGGSNSGGSNSGGQGSAGSQGSGASTGSGSSAASSTTQVVVISTGSYVVDASVDDTEVGQVKAGDSAVITPNGSTEPVNGTVASVGLLAKTSSSVPSYPVTIAVNGSPAGLFAGAGAQVSIVAKQVTDAVVVPAAAIHYQNGNPVVYQQSGGQRVPRQVTLGMTEGGQTQVISGLAVGDQVVVPGASGNRGGSAGNGSGGNGSGGNGSGGNGSGGGKNGSGRGGGGGGRGGGLGGLGGGN